MKYSDIPQFTQSASYRINMPWTHLESWIKDHAKSIGINLSPEYQRDHVWTEKQEIRYVEYILRGGKTGREIFFNCPSWNKLRNQKTIELVDGKQRIKAVRRFLNNEIKAFNTYYNEFEDEIRSLGGPDFIIHVNDLKTQKEVMQWYVDMNAGGTVHTDDEINRVKKLIEAEG